jgi:predicted SAM-dependent methyltransferase
MKLGLSFIVKMRCQRKTAKNVKKNAHKSIRQLEIGPGLTRLEGFETLNIIDGKNVDYIADISSPLPFQNNSFDLIYASHVIEHIPWFLQKQLFSELNRILKPKGCLEIWVPDFSKIIEVVNSYFQYGENLTGNDGWYRFNEDKDVMTWVNGRIFTYGDGTSNPQSFNWHRCVYTEESLTQLFRNAGFTEIKAMTHEEVRGYDHGWINLGIKGSKT